MSNAATTGDDRPHGTGLLPRPLTPAEMSNAPVLASLDALVIDDLTDEEYGRFLAALAE
jgi:hypothetical protein